MIEDFLQRANDGNQLILVDAIYTGYRHLAIAQRSDPLNSQVSYDPKASIIYGLTGVNFLLNDGRVDCTKDIISRGIYVPVNEDKILINPANGTAQKPYSFLQVGNYDVQTYLDSIGHWKKGLKLKDDLVRVRIAIDYFRESKLHL
jgi:hypothetical protein